MCNVKLSTAMSNKQSVPDDSRTPVSEVLAHIANSLSSEAILVEFAPTDAARFLESLKAYFAALPHHGQTDAVAQAKVERVEDAVSSRFNVTVFHESRSIVRAKAPYKGWKIPQLRRNESNTNAWEFDWPPPPLPSPSPSEKKIIADSQEMHWCAECERSGQTTCERCQGAKHVGCGGCNSTGKVNCGTCDGTGSEKRTRKVQSFRPCGSCTANTLMNVVAIFDNNPYTRVRVCPRCRGTGQEPFIAEENYEVPCPKCKTTGKVMCIKCKGTKRLTCAGCTGKGKKTCNNCKGEKAVVSYLEIVRTFSETRHERDVGGPFVQKLFEASLQNPFSIGHVREQHWEIAGPEEFLQTLQEREAAAAKSFLGLNLRTLRQTVEEGMVESTSGSRPVAIHLRNSVILTRCVTYSVLRNRYRAIWDSKLRTKSGALPSRREVISHKSIVSNWCRLRVAELKSVASEAGQRQAALQLQELSKIGELDPVCEKVMKESISASSIHNIAELSQSVKYSTNQIILFAVSALLSILSVGLLFALTDNIPGFFVLGVSGVLALIAIKVAK